MSSLWLPVFFVEICRDQLFIPDLWPVLLFGFGCHSLSLYNLNTGRWSLAACTSSGYIRPILLYKGTFARFVIHEVVLMPFSVTESVQIHSKIRKILFNIADQRVWIFAWSWWIDWKGKQKTSEGRSLWPKASDGIREFILVVTGNLLNLAVICDFMY